MQHPSSPPRRRTALLALAAAAFLAPSPAAGDDFIGVVDQGQLIRPDLIDPLTIPKYVIPLVIPPVMKNDGTEDSYDIAVRQFKQQVLPGGIWNEINGRDDRFKPTLVWSYGPASDPVPPVAPDPASQYNYPAYTVETTADVPVDVRWINGLVRRDGRYLRHLLRVDQTLHWANPPAGPGQTDTVGDDPKPYNGPVPMVPHVHGAHVSPHSDGYPEAWWLPNALNLPSGFARHGRLFDDATGVNPGTLGYADYHYSNDQAAATLWYHDHTLGMTRLNVYAGPAGFWLVRGGPYDGALVGDDDDGPDDGDDEEKVAVLPGPAPVAGQGVLELNVPGEEVRSSIREIPVVIQDRSFKKNGHLWYPDERSYFEGLFPSSLQIDTAPETDVKPYWVPEAFFDVMVVNGVTWPELEVAQSLYRLRLLNGCNSRFLNLALVVESSPDESLEGMELPFFQIGGDQGFLSQPVMVSTGFATVLPGDGELPSLTPAPDPDQALVMALAERADVLVDFRGLPDGTVVRMTNTAPDEPFGGFSGEPEPGDESVANPRTTGQVMQFVVDSSLTGASPTDPGGPTPATDPWSILPNAEGALPAVTNPEPRKISLNELESDDVCVLATGGSGHDTEYVVPIVQVPCDTPSPTPDGELVVPFGPTEALLGTVVGEGAVATGIPLHWTAHGAGVPRTVTVPSGTHDIYVTENPAVGAVEEWDIYNFTGDAHPIHLHLVRFEVVSRTVIDEEASPPGQDIVLPNETGYKDTVIAYPGQITRVKAHFDVEGLYVWHCHILEHEDNEMMRPYYVGD